MFLTTTHLRGKAMVLRAARRASGPFAVLAAGPIPQVDLVQYQTCSAVSRTLIKKPTGTVAAFAFDVGEELSEHTPPFDALVLMVDRKAEIVISGVPHRVKAADAWRGPQ